MTDYLALCSCLRTEGKNEEMYAPNKALKVIAVGSFDEKAVAELEDYRAKKADDRKQHHKNLIRRVNRRPWSRMWSNVISGTSITL